MFPPNYFVWVINNQMWKATGLLHMISLAILPSVNAWINLEAMWDPYSNMSGIKIAVTSNDEGAAVEDKPIRWLPYATFNDAIRLYVQGGVIMKRLVMLMFLVVFLFPVNTFALSCAGMPSIEKAYEEYDGVVIGRVETVIRKKESNQIQFTVIKSFKGTQEHQISADENITWGTLNGPSEVGEQYLLFLRKKESEWENPLCSPAKKLADATKELEYLKDKEIPLKETKVAIEPANLRAANSSVHWAVIVIIVGLTGTILYGFLRNKKRANKN